MVVCWEWGLGVCREEVVELGWIDDVIVFVYTYTVLDNSYPLS